jgi:hypothetical protein
MPLRPPDAEMPAEYWESVLNDPQVAAKPGVPIQQRRLADLAVSTYVRFAPEAAVQKSTSRIAVRLLGSKGKWLLWITSRLSSFKHVPCPGRINVKPPVDYFIASRLE